MTSTQQELIMGSVGKAPEAESLLFIFHFHTNEVLKVKDLSAL